MVHSGKYLTTSNQGVTKVELAPAAPVLPDVKKPVQEEKKPETTGDKWFNMPAPRITPELKKDLLILKSRGVLDPKRHYKKDKRFTSGMPKFFQVGTIVDPLKPGSETKKTSFVKELLQDEQKTAYYKKKFVEIQKRNVQSAPAWMRKKILAKKLKLKSRK